VNTSDNDTSQQDDGQHHDMYYDSNSGSEDSRDSE
jgi:hypothetical protein